METELWILGLTPLIGAGMLMALHPSPARCTSIGRFVSLFCFVFVIIKLIQRNSLPTPPKGWWWIDSGPGLSLGNITGELAIDGLSMALLLLTTGLFSLAWLIAPRTLTVRPRLFMALMLIMESGCLFTFMARNLFLFYMAFESLVIPMFAMIVLWGGTRRQKAARVFLVYTMISSTLLLAGLLCLYNTSGSVILGNIDVCTMTNTQQKIVWWLFFMALAIKLPLIPFHTWLPLAHSEAPTWGSVFLASILLKVGAYGFVRLPFGLFPEISLLYQTFVSLLSIISLLYGAWLAYAQTDIKRMVAYASVAHMGYITLGLAQGHTDGTQGACFQMISHGISSAGLFLCVGFLYQRFHHRDWGFYQGLQKLMPRFSFFWAIFILSTLSLPGTAGFIGEFFVLLSTACASPIWVTLGAASGMVLGAIYALKGWQSLCGGSPSSGLTLAPPPLLRDVPSWNAESFVFWILVILILGLGIFPEFLMSILSHQASSYAPLVTEGIRL